MGVPITFFGAARYGATEELIAAIGPFATCREEFPGSASGQSVVDWPALGFGVAFSQLNGSSECSPEGTAILEATFTGDWEL